MNGIWARFEADVLGPGNCTHCGACAGLNPEVLEFKRTARGPLPSIKARRRAGDLPNLRLAWAVCPGRGVPFAELFDYLGRTWTDKLLGPHRALYVGHATDERIRGNAASGGVISRVLVHMLESGAVAGVIAMRQGVGGAERAAPVIARSREEILACAQSVYSVTPVLDILPAAADVEGPLAFAGLPDQMAALRMLQAAGHPVARRVLFTAGPYTGTNLYEGAVRAFLRAKGVGGEARIERIRWRAGQWPGYLEVKLEDGRVFRSEKFHYNYLIPFYAARSCQITPDFTNELADLSVGDAWSPRFEKDRRGYSVVVARSAAACEALECLRVRGELALDPIPREEALSMHGHMLDFKKRGTFVRLAAQKQRGKPIPEFGYAPARIPLSRKAVEAVISGAFTLGGTDWARRWAGRAPLGVIGPAFNVLRKGWKLMSRPTKRRGLADCEFLVTRNPDRWREITSWNERTD